MNCGDAVLTTLRMELAEMQKSLPLFESGRYERTIYTRCSQYGTPFGVGICIGPNGEEHTCLADSREIDLDLLEHLEGQDVRFAVTEKGLRLKPLAQQSDELVAVLIERLERGPNPDRVKPPELVEDSDPPTHPAEDELHPSIPVIGELIAYTAKVALERNLPMAGWAFIPPGARQ